MAHLIQILLVAVFVTIGLPNQSDVFLANSCNPSDYSSNLQSVLTNHGSQTDLLQQLENKSKKLVKRNKALKKLRQKTFTIVDGNSVKANDTILGIPGVIKDCLEQDSCEISVVLTEIEKYFQSQKVINKALKRYLRKLSKQGKTKALKTLFKEYKELANLNFNLLSAFSDIEGVCNNIDELYNDLGAAEFEDSLATGDALVIEAESGNLNNFVTEDGYIYQETPAERIRNSASAKYVFTAPSKGKYRVSLLLSSDTSSFYLKFNGKVQKKKDLYKFPATADFEQQGVVNKKAVPLVVSLKKGNNKLRIISHKDNTVSAKIDQIILTEIFDGGSTDTPEDPDNPDEPTDPDNPDTPEEPSPTPNPLVCGNNIIETNEQCDDGNTLSNDGCSNTCRVEIRSVVSDAESPDFGSDSCEDIDVQAAINQAEDGNIVLVPAGACTWSTPIIIPSTKGVTLKGAGIGQTIITDTYAVRGVLQLNVVSPFFSRVTGFTFDLNGIDKTGNRATILVNAEGDQLNAFRIDSNHFIDIRDRAIGINANVHEISGLIDNNVFRCPFDAACQSVRVNGSLPQISSHMGRPFEPGSNKYIFFENNETFYSFPNDGGLEGYGGARYVYRFNKIHGHTQGHHGADSGNLRGTQVFEIYGNTSDLQGADPLASKPARSFLLRSGTGFLFNNTTTFGNLHIQNYRSDPGWTFNWLGLCDGTEVHDGNTPGSEGYPCIDQVGHMFTDVMDGSSTLTPLYVFENTKLGAQHDIAPKHTTGDGTRLYTLHMLENREFYNQKQTFDGTVGVGVGTIAERPVTCTINTGYWATDEGDWNSKNGATKDGQFYKCTSTDTWSLYYTPYTYPHPLSEQER